MPSIFPWCEPISAIQAEPSSHVQDVVPYDVDTSETAPFVVQGDEVPLVYEKVAANPNNACHQNFSELSIAELFLPSGWVMTSHEIEGSKMVILLTHKSIKKGCESGFPYCFLTEKASWIHRIFII